MTLYSDVKYSEQHNVILLWSGRCQRVSRERGAGALVFGPSNMSLPMTGMGYLSVRPGPCLAA